MLTDDQIVNNIANELQQAAGGSENDFIDANRQQALAYYLGQPNGHEVEGKSRVTSTDVADAIEWIVPQIVKAFTQNGEVVRFDPVGEHDRDQAELETQICYDVLMKENEGFIALHSFIKDCLLQKNGVFKVWYDDDLCETVERYTGINQMHLVQLSADPELELLELSEMIKITDNEGLETMAALADIDPAQIPPASIVEPFIDCKFKRTKDNGRVRIEPIAPEQFRVNRQHPSLDLKDARFTAHVQLKTRSDLLEEGYKKEIVEAIPLNTGDEVDKDYRWYYQQETVYPDQSASTDPSQALIEVSECYCRMDIDEDGIAELVKVTLAGGYEVGTLLDVEEISEVPFVASTAILMPHKFFGLSVFDRLKEIQDQKTALWRNMLDNLYLQNNARTVAVDGQVNIDDLLVSRPGGIIRAKAPGMLEQIKAPPIGSDAQAMMGYLDQVAAGRSGVSQGGAAQDFKVGSETAHGIERVMTAQEELTGLMIRVIAETGIKPLFYMIRCLLMRHVDAAQEVEFKGQWQQTNPAQWQERKNATVRVGTGTGDRSRQQSALMNIANFQEKILANPQQTLLDQKQIFKLVDDLAKVSGLQGARAYFIDPDSPEGIQKAQQKQESDGKNQQQQQQLQQAMAQSQQGLANAELQKAAAQTQNVQLKAQLDAAKLEQQQAQAMADQHIKQLEQQLSQAEAMAKAAESDAKIQLERDKLEQQTALKLTELEMSQEQDLSPEQAENASYIEAQMQANDS